MARGLQVFPQQMAANMTADGGMLMAEAVMIAVAPKLGRLEAHHLVYDACRTARQRRLEFDRVLVEALGSHTVADLPPLEELLDPVNYLGEVDSIIDAALDSGGQRVSR
jgi:3-carboxy-cis,cis-muconate cycloisomerase